MTAYVVPEVGIDITPEVITEHCRNLIAAYKIPRIVHLVESLPLTPSGKIRKADIRQLARTAVVDAN